MMRTANQRRLSPTVTSRGAWRSWVMLGGTIVALVPLALLGLAASIASSETKEWDRPWAEGVIAIFWVSLGAWLILAAVTFVVVVRRRRQLKQPVETPPSA